MSHFFHYEISYIYRLSIFPKIFVITGKKNKHILSWSILSMASTIAHELQDSFGAISICS